MEHISEAQLTAIAFEQVMLSAQEMAHLATCAECRTRLARLQRLAQEFAVARQSEPPPAVRATAYAHIAQVQQKPSWIQRLVERLPAQLLWDSRQQLTAQGLRTLPAARYHLLYTTEQIDVELDVQPQGTGLQVEGDLLLATGEGADQTASLAPSLLHLQPVKPGDAAYESDCDAQGHFYFHNVAPGRYTLLITPHTGALIEIVGLELV